MVSTLTHGGAERVVASWANGLSSLGHQVEILTDLNSPITYQPADDVKLTHFKRFKPRANKGFFKLVNRFRNLMFNIHQFKQIIETSQPDVIVNVLYADIHHLLLAKHLYFRSVPIIMTDHNAYERPQGVKMPHSQYLNKFLDSRFVDYLTVLTHADRQILLDKGIRKVDVLHNPLFLKPVVDVPQKEKIVLAVGRLEAWFCKGFDILMKAWIQVHEKHPDWKLIVKGSCNEDVIAMLKDIAARAKESIEFAPYDGNVQELYRKASIFVLSSRYEGWGLVAVEAMSQGCATIACDFKGRQAEFINDGENGLLCATHDPQQLGEKICFLIENPIVRKQLQENAMLGLEKFSEENVAKNLLSIIDKVLHNQEL